MKPDPVRAIADAVLYEGYVLWPYRRSALKNQRRFTFGGVYPPAHSERHSDDPSLMQTEVLLRGDSQTRIDVTVRFLQVVRRDVARWDGERLEPVEELVVGDERHLAWEEAVERELSTPALELGRLAGEGHRMAIEVAADCRREEVRGPDGALAGALVRSWKELRGELQVWAAELGGGVYRLSAQIANATPFGPGSREEALGFTFCSTHTLLHVERGELLSLADPPPELRAAAAACTNLGTWPVPVGEPGDRSTMLSSPIILEDYPRVAPESPGDLFDGGEIDQLLILNILALTEAEKVEMAASDPRAREILERTEALTPAQLMRLHGTIRELGMVR